MFWARKELVKKIPFTIKEAEEFIARINSAENSKYQILQLSYQGYVNEELLLSLVSGLKSNNTLEVIELAEIHPTSNALHALKELLEENDKLEIEGLRSNSFQGSDAQCVEEINSSSAINGAIKKLRKNDNRYPERTVDLSGFYINDRNISKLLENLEEDKLITHLNLNDNCIGNIGLSKIIDMLAKNKMINEISLEGNIIDSGNEDSLIPLLKALRDRAYLRLGRNYLTPEAMVAIEDNVKYNVDFRCSLSFHQKNHLLWAAEGREYRLYFKQPYVYLVRNTRSGAGDDPEHVMLWLHGINNQGQTYIYRAHLTKNKSCASSSSIFSRKPLEVSIDNFKPMRLFDSINDYVYLCWTISTTEMETLEQDIRNDIKENLRGYNCFEWAKSKLANIGIQIPPKWIDVWPRQYITGQEHPNENTCVLF